MKLTIYTDGGCDIHNTKQGGWGVVIYHQNFNFLKSGFGGTRETTNNKMELQAFYETLIFLESETELHKVEIRPDSKYVIGIFDGISMDNKIIIYGSSWLGGWKKSGWNKAGGIKNLELIQNIHTSLCKVLKKGHTLTWKHCKAHCGYEGNELADQLATLGRHHRKNLI